MVQFLDFVRRGKIFFFFRAVNDIRIFFSQESPVRRNNENFQPVNLFELGRFGFRGTGHASKFLVHAEIILKGDGRKRLIFALNFDTLFGFYGLVQAIGPAATGHQAPGELIDNDYFAVFHHIFHITAIERMRLHRGLDVVLEIPILRIGNVPDAEEALDFFPSFVRNRDVAMLFVNHEIAGEYLRLAGSSILFFAFCELGNDAIDFVILISRFLAGAGDDQRSPGFIDQDGVDFVHNPKVVPTLHAILHIELHVVAQVVEAKFVVGTVGHVGCIGFAALFVVEIMDDHADAEAEESIELTHPFGVALGEVVIDRDDVYAASAERIEVDRQGGNQRLTLARLHLGDLAFVQYDAADKLHIEMAHVKHAAARLADDSESLDKDFVEGFVEHLGALFFELLDAIRIGVRLVRNRAEAFLDAAAEFVSFGAQLLVRELLHLGLEHVHSLDARHQTLDFALVSGAENFGCK